MAMAYDAARGRTVLFGGSPEVTGYLDETWEWDGRAWHPREVPSSSRPPARTWQGMAWDAARQVTVMYGGQGNAGRLGDTWEWDGSSWSQRVTAVAPPARSGPMMVYDSRRGRVVLYGGAGTGGVLRDTWEWDGATWQQRNTPVAPPPLTRVAMAYDAVRGVTVLHAGKSTELWEWDGNSWTSFTVPGTGSTEQRAYFDAARARVVFFGGRSFPSTVPNADLWEWDGATLTQRNVPPGPSGRYWHAITYDTQRDRAVLYGGWTPYSRGDRNTWEFDGTGWLRGGPEGRASHSASYDSVRHRMVVVAGNPYGSTVPLEDTWEWDGDVWYGPWPAPPNGPFLNGRREMHATAFDAARNETVLFGGVNAGQLLNDTWTWDGATWTQKNPATRPPGQAGHRMVYEPKQQRVLLFGSYGTWTWDGTDWTHLDPPNAPSPRAFHGLAYDSERDRVVLFGGEGALSDTWEWDGQTWHRMAPAQSPPGRKEHSMAYDPFRGLVVMTGGRAAWFFDDTWEWDGTNWYPRFPAGLGTTIDSTMVWVPSRRASVLFGGVSGEQLWQYTTNAPGSYTPFGSACVGTAGAPVLRAAPGSTPWPGVPFTVEVDRLPTNAVAALALGASNTTWSGLALPFTIPATGSPGCVVSVSLDVVVPLVHSGSLATWTLQIPANERLPGQSYYNQAIVIDPGANPLGITTSNAGSALIGAR